MDVFHPPTDRLLPPYEIAIPQPSLWPKYAVAYIRSQLLSSGVEIYASCPDPPIPWILLADSRPALPIFLAQLTGSKRNVVSGPTRPVLDRAICKVSAPGEAEAGSAGTQPS